MNSIGISALLLAIASNVTANIFLKRAVRSVEADGTGLMNVLHVLASPAAWVGFISAAVLLVAYLVALRMLPLSPTYATVTAATIAILTIFGAISGDEHLGTVKLIGIGAIVFGFVLIVAPFGES